MTTALDAAFPPALLPNAMHNIRRSKVIIHNIVINHEINDSPVEEGHRSHPLVEVDTGHTETVVGLHNHQAAPVVAHRNLRIVVHRSWAVRTDLQVQTVGTDRKLAVHHIVAVGVDRKHLDDRLVDHHLRRAAFHGLDLQVCQGRRKERLDRYRGVGHIGVAGSVDHVDCVDVVLGSVHSPMDCRYRCLEGTQTEGRRVGTRTAALSRYSPQRNLHRPSSHNFAGAGPRNYSISDYQKHPSCNKLTEP